MAGLHSAWRFGFGLDAERGTACAGLLLSMQSGSWAERGLRLCARL